MLADEGKLTLDDPVGKYVPGLTGGDTVTIRQILSHTSGYRDYWPQDFSFADMQHPVTPGQILDRWGKAPLDFPPGTQWQYSNTGFVIAGQIIEKVSGQSLLPFLSARAFQPLGMASAVDADTGMTPADATPHERYALGPVRVAKPAAAGWLFAAGELAMTASDLARWDIGMMDHKLLSQAGYAAQQTSREARRRRRHALRARRRRRCTGARTASSSMAARRLALCRTTSSRPMTGSRWWCSTMPISATPRRR